VKHIRFIRAHADGEVYSGPGQCDEVAFEVLKGLPNGGDLIVLSPDNPARMDDKIDRKTLKIVRKGPSKKVNLAKVLKAAAKTATPQITVEELTDALLGDKKALAALKRKRKKG
jgi:hypothetical protein